MESYHVFWLLDELETLTRKQVISEEIARRIADYYAPVPRPGAVDKAEASSARAVGAPDAANASGTASTANIYREINKRRGENRSHARAPTVRSIPVLLSVIAAILIASGIISLIAYNWHAIPRMAKAVSAFVLLLAVESAGVCVGFAEKRFSRAAWREGVSLLWAILFGGVLAYISQICRLPGDTAAFLLVWSVSSVLLTYAMQSAGVFVLSLLLSAAYAVFARMGGGEPALFCLLFAALCPFAFRFRYGRHAMLLLAASMLGFVLEKSIPGLWIVCSVSLAVFAVEYGLDKGFRAVVALASSGLCILLLVLSNNSLWCGVGWLHIRGSRSVLGMLLDCSLALGLTLLSLAWQFVPFLGGMRKEAAFRRWQLAYPFCALAVAVLFAVYSCLPAERARTLYLAPTVMVFLFSLLFVVHALSGRKKSSLFLLCFLCASAFSARLGLPVFALASFLLLLEATGLYPPAATRALAFALLLLATACLRTTPLLQYRMPRPHALPGQIVLYLLQLLAALFLFARSKSMRKSADIIGGCAAVVFFAILGLALPLGKDALAMGYFMILLLACAYHVVCHGRLPGGREGRGEALCYWLPFAALCAHFFWTALFVLKLNCPLLAGTAFLFLFLAAACCRLRANPRDELLLGGLSRLLVSFWMLASFFLCVDRLSFAVYDRAAAPFQIASYCCVLLAALVLFLRSANWKSSLDFLLALLGICAVSLWYRPKGNAFPVGFVYLFLLAGLYGFVRLQKDGMRIYIPYVLLFVGTTAAFLFAATKTVFLCCPAFPLFASLYFYGRKRLLAAGGEKAAVPWTGTLGQMLCVAVIYVSAFVPPRFADIRPPSVPLLVPLLLALALYALVSLLPAALLFRTWLCSGMGQKGRCNYLFALYALAVVVCFLLLLVVGAARPDSEAARAFWQRMAASLSYGSFAFVFLTAGYYIYEAYTEGGLAKANLFAASAALALAVKFFGDDYGFVAKGLLFIVLGLAMLLLNLLLCRLDRKKKTEPEVSHDALP